MKFGGVCITTNNVSRLVDFYQTVLQEKPFQEGKHYAFSSLAVYDPGGVTVTQHNNTWLQCFDSDIDALYERLLREIPGIEIIDPPIRRPWGAYSFWFKDPDGNKIAVAQNREDS